MKVQSCSLTADALKGAIVSYADGTEMGVIVDISFNLDCHAVVVMIRQKHKGISGIPWEAMKNWKISLQPETWTNNIDTYVDKMSDIVEDILERQS
tara:strand:+ start:137 stop:424 length:288 start_codon:yes stop_codon:yes gene_type:complete